MRTTKETSSASWSRRGSRILRRTQSKSGQIAVFEQRQGQEHGDGAIEEAIDERPGQILQRHGNAGRDAGLNVEVIKHGQHRGDEPAEKDDWRKLLGHDLRLDEQWR